MTFTIYEDRRGEWRWRLAAKNGRIIADSGEGYVAWAGAHAAVQRIKAGAADAQVVARDPEAPE